MGVATAASAAGRIPGFFRVAADQIDADSVRRAPSPQGPEQREEQRRRDHKQHQNGCVDPERREAGHAAC